MLAALSNRIGDVALLIVIAWILSSSSVFCPRAGPSLQTQAPRLQILSKGRSSIANSGTKVAVLLGMNRCSSFPLFSAPHSPLSIWTNLKRCEKIPGAPSRRWGDWIWLLGPPDFTPKFTTGVKYQFHQGFWPDQRSGNPNHPSPPHTHIYIYMKARNYYLSSPM